MGNFALLPSVLWITSTPSGIDWKGCGILGKDFETPELPFRPADERDILGVMVLKGISPGLVGLELGLPWLLDKPRTFNLSGFPRRDRGCCISGKFGTPGCLDTDPICDAGRDVKICDIFLLKRSFDIYFQISQRKFSLHLSYSHNTITFSSRLGSNFDYSNVCVCTTTMSQHSARCQWEVRNYGNRKVMYCHVNWSERESVIPGLRGKQCDVDLVWFGI